MSITIIIYSFSNFQNKVSEQFSSHCKKSFPNYYIITNLINNSNVVIRGSNAGQNKKAYIEVTLHLVFEVKESGQVTFE